MKAGFRWAHYLFIWRWSRADR